MGLPPREEKEERRAEFWARANELAGLGGREHPSPNDFADARGGNVAITSDYARAQAVGTAFVEHGRDRKGYPWSAEITRTDYAVWSVRVVFAPDHGGFEPFVLRRDFTAPDYVGDFLYEL